MLVEVFGEGAELGSQGEKVIVILHFGVGYAEKLLSGYKFKEKATETPDINCVVVRSRKNQLGGSKTGWSHGSCWWVGKEICYLG